jgi:tetratricopeptide (TPR) repeat protein
MAQQIVDYAWKQKNYKNKAKYAKEALAICEDCSDAYIILSKDSNLNSNERRAFLEKAVKAAQNVLKIDNLENAKPELLNSKIAEPFFGAKYNLAIHLWDSGERGAAIESALEILKYDEKDSLMVRSIVVNWLLIEKKYEQLKSLIEKYEKDKLAAIHYSNAVLLYKTKEVKNAEHALRRAYKRNPHVIPYILKQKKVPNLLPRLIRFGSEEEAMKYASLGLEVWNDADLIKWVKEKKKDFDMVIQN